MKNYAEELAYWYLRFNGFFLLDGHVVHRGGEHNDGGLNQHQAHAHSENDLLGIRTPFVQEGVGFPAHPCPILAGIIPEHALYIGVICEVKAGIRPRINDHNLSYQINRIGLFEENVGIPANIIANGSHFHGGNALIRILIKQSPLPVQGWNIITLHQMIAYIRERTGDIHKSGGWDKFNSPLIQFLIKDAIHD